MPGWSAQTVKYFPHGRLFLPSGEAIINDIGLAALALLIAESNPKDKDVLIRLTMNMLVKDPQ